MKTIKILYLIAVPALLLACSAEGDVPQRAANDGRQPILLSAASASGSRAGQDIQNTQFKKSQEIDVQITSEDNQTIYDLLTYNTVDANGTMVPKMGVYPYYPTNKAKLSIRAIYPSGYMKKTTFEVRNPQIEEVDYRASDLMFATLSDIETPDAEVTHQLEFRHLLTKIQVVLTGEGGVNLNNSVVTLMNVRTSTTYSNATGEVSTTGTGSTIPMIISDDGSIPCAAIIPPQQVPSGYFIEIALANNDILYYHTAQSTLFESGKVYTFNIKVIESNISVTTTITDWDKDTDDVEQRLKT